jgi:ribonucleoside-triphosphate reductase
MTSTRAEIITRRTYCRPTNEEATEFETWEQVVERVLLHQQWLWERAQGKALDEHQKDELNELRILMAERKALPSGRTLWLGGTDVAKTRESSQFNCSYVKVATISDAVDVIWLLLQGCGVGFRPSTGTLSGFSKPIPTVKHKLSTRSFDYKGREHNRETWDADTKTWTISVGDSAEGWSKAFGKLLAGKYPANILVFDTTNVRGAGARLSGYGWISQGDKAMQEAVGKICEIMSRRANQLLTAIDILDIVNLMGTILSSRRSAEIALYPYGNQEWYEFATAKKDYWQEAPWRSQSNNSLLFYNKPSQQELLNILGMMYENGGSEPGFYNADAARIRAPWFKGTNPCGEILLGNKSFCNLVEVNLAAFKDDPRGLHRAMQIIARANYRQTCVNLDDGMLQRTWHENNEFLRLCGVGVTGVVARPDLTPYDYRVLRNYATVGAYSMADELGMPRPKLVTTVKPSGTLSKIMDCPEGGHKPGGRYIFNNVNFGKLNPMVAQLQAAGYEVRDNPLDDENVLVKLPISHDDVEFAREGDVWYNNESAIDQLNRYKMLMDNYVDHNASITVSYDASEIQGISEWLHHNWDSYVGVSFLLRQDPRSTAEDLGHPYLPQEVVEQKEYANYVSNLRPVQYGAEVEDEFEDACATGACPIR